jgi:hypothetical protein
VLLGLLSKDVQDHARLDAGDLSLRIDLQHPVLVLGEIEDHAGVAALAREARPAASRQHWRTEFPADLEGGGDVLRVPRDDDADRHLPVVRRVRGIEAAAAVVEADLASDRGIEGRRERLRVDARPGLLGCPEVRGFPDRFARRRAHHPMLFLRIRRTASVVAP